MSDVKKEMCEEYEKIKPFLTDILPIIEKDLPDGKKIAEGLKILMGIADAACYFE